MVISSTYRQKKPLITYSKKSRIPLLPLDGTQFLRERSETAATSATDLLEDGNFNCSRRSTSPSSNPSNSLSLNHAEPRIPLSELSITGSATTDQHVFPTMLSVHAYDSDNTISEDRDSGSVVQGNHNISSSRRAYLGLSSIRKSFKVSRPLMTPPTTSKSTSKCVAAEVSNVMRGSDGFTSSEARNRIGPSNRIRTLRYLKFVGRLDIATGPLPDVQFITTRLSDRISDDLSDGMLRLSKYSGNEETDSEQVTDISDVDKPEIRTSDRNMSFSNRLVFAQLSSISAPRLIHEDSMPSVTDQSGDEEYQANLLCSEPSDHLERSESMSDAPGYFSSSEEQARDTVRHRQSHCLLSVPGLAAPHEDIFDDGPPGTARQAIQSSCVLTYNLYSTTAMRKTCNQSCVCPPS